MYIFGSEKAWNIVVDLAASPKKIARVRHNSTGLTRCLVCLCKVLVLRSSYLRRPNISTTFAHVSNGQDLCRKAKSNLLVLALSTLVSILVGWRPSLIGSFCIQSKEASRLDTAGSRDRGRKTRWAVSAKALRRA